MNDKKDMAQWLEEQFPDHTPEERFVEWQKMNLEAIEEGWLIANLLEGDNIFYIHIDHATPKQIAAAMTPTQYRLWMER